MAEDVVPDIATSVPQQMAECPLIDAVEEKRKEARMVAWAGVLIAIMGVLSWSTYGFFACGGAAIVFGLYARRFAPTEGLADLAAGGMLLVIFGLRLSGIL
jgi:hypothetical protein